MGSFSVLLLLKDHNVNKSKERIVKGLDFSIMNFLLVGILLFASVASLKAERATEAEIAKFPPFLAKCLRPLATCYDPDTDDEKKLVQCFLAFPKCIHDNRPPKYPPFFEKCKLALVKCKKAANGDYKKQVRCFMVFPSCLRDNLPS